MQSLPSRLRSFSFKLSLTLSTSIVLVGTAGCAQMLAGYHQMKVVATGGLEPETATKIDAMSKKMDALIAADDFEGAIALSAELWDVAGYDNTRQSAIFPPLNTLADAVRALPTTHPAYQAASILKLAMNKQFYASGLEGPTTDLEAFRAELTTLFQSIESRAKPELVEKAAALEANNQPASAVAVYAQLLALYPDDADAKAKKEALLQSLKATHGLRVRATGSAAANTLAANAFGAEAITFDQAGPVTVTLTLGEPTTDVSTAAETQTAQVVRGKKSVPNRDYERLQEKIAHTEKLRSENTRQTDIDRRTDEIASLNKQLSRESPTELVDDVVSESFPGTRTTRTVRRTLVKITRGAEVLGELQDTASASKSALSHGGHPAARVAALNEAVPTVDDVDDDTIAAAASRARTPLLVVYRTHLTAIVKAVAVSGGDAVVEAAALAVALDPGNASEADAKAVKTGLRIADPRVLLTAK
jgi:hypothetical protein